MAEPRPFAPARERVVLAVPEGLSVAELIELAGIKPALRPLAVAYIGAERIEPRYFHRVRPKAGALVLIKVVPAFGDGSTFRAIAMLAVLALGAAATAATGGLLLPVLGAAGAGIAAGLAGAAVSLVGTLAINALMPMQPARLENLAGTTAAARVSPTLSITGSRNRVAPYAPVPRCFGKTRVRPLMAARPFAEIAGEDQYLRLLFDFGYGPLTLSSMKIGGIDLSEYDDVATVTHTDYQGATLQLYPDTVSTEALNLEVTKAAGSVTLKTATATAEIVLDVTFKNGFFQDQLVVGGGGSELVRTAESVQIKVEHRLAGTPDAFVDAGTFTHTAYTKSLSRFAIRVVLPSANQWDIKVTRLTDDNDVSSSNTERRTRSWLTALNSIEYASPVNVTGHTLVEMRIRATDQINGVVDTFSAVAEAQLPIYTATGSPTFETKTTRNPAWAALEVLRGAANARPWADANIDLGGFKAFADRCDELDQNGEPKYRFDGVVDFSTTVFQVMRDILSTARADFTIQDGKASVVWDDPDAVTVQAFTPKNSHGFKASRTYPKLPHALRVRFVNEDVDWQEDEITVYDDGFTALNATRFETLELWGVTREPQAWREGRYRLAEGRLRPEVVEFQADIEHLVCQRGDKVQMTHDVMLWGLASGRIKSLTTDGGGNVTAITLDETVTMEAGKSYGITIRKAADTTFTTHAVDTTAGNTAILMLSVAIPAGSAPAVGEFVQFGISGAETVEMKVKAILPGPELSARIVCVDPAPAVHTSDTGLIPDFDPRITVPPTPGVVKPPTPVILDVKSDETVLIPVAGGGLEPQILVTLQLPATTTEIGHGEAQYRPTGTTQAWEVFIFDRNANKVSFRPVVEGLAYNLRLRYVSVAGLESEFAVVVGHKVVGKSTLPPDVPSALIDANNRISWPYPVKPVDFDGWQIRYHQGTNTNWATALKAHEGLLRVAEFDGSLLKQGGQVTVMIKGFDVALNESANAAVLILSLGDPKVANVVETRDFKADGFPGTITDGTVDGAGDLVADDTGVAFWSGVDATQFWQADDAQAFWSTLYKQMTYLATWAPPSTGQLTLTLTVVAVSWSIEYRPIGAQVLFWTQVSTNKFWSGTDSNAFWSPPPDFQPWPGAIEATTQQYEFRLITASGAIQGKVTVFKATVDVADVEEHIQDAAIAAGGTRLTLAKTYTKIKFVGIDIQADANQARSIEITDKDVSQGPLIKAFNAAGTQVAATVDAFVQGY
ncbi:MAG: host specificity factor TipJ family phage tail protein [Kiloniellales bacterium]